MTLGFICEKLKIFNIAHCLSSNLIDTILMGILLGMQKTEPSKEIKF
jgi:hypothetical protein